jgi:hypothetical protein
VVQSLVVITLLPAYMTSPTGWRSLFSTSTHDATATAMPCGHAREGAMNDGQGFTICGACGALNRC